MCAAYHTGHVPEGLGNDTHSACRRCGRVVDRHLRADIVPLLGWGWRVSPESWVCEAGGVGGHDDRALWAHGAAARSGQRCWPAVHPADRLEGRVRDDDRPSRQAQVKRIAGKTFRGLNCHTVPVFFCAQTCSLVQVPWAAVPSKSGDGWFKVGDCGRFGEGCQRRADS